jgi:uncharacterized protein (DUF1501 family)
MRVIDRRHFLKGSATGIGSAVLLRGLGLSGLLGRTARAAGGPRSLVLLRLYGGNDGLNTVIPYTDGNYFSLRPTIAVAPGAVLPLNGTVGLHPNMASMKAHYDAGRLAVIQSVGYPNMNLSHFRSEVIWQSADPVGFTSTGWLGRYLDAISPPGDEAVRAVDVSYYLEPVLASDHANVFAFPNLDRIEFPSDGAYDGDRANKRAAFDAISLLSRTPGSVPETLARGGYVLSQNLDLYAAIPDGTSTSFPNNRLARDLRTVARMIGAARGGDIAAGIYQVSIDGFDTHSDQDSQGGHPDLWARIDGALNAFYQELIARGAADDTIVLLYSEFGRRVEENGSLGTDHGTAAPMFVLGNPVVGGLYGPDPDLVNVDGDGNLVHTVDFREVYATVLERWLAGDSAAVLGGSFTPVPFLS